MTTSNPSPAARSWADIDLGAVLANARTVRDASGARLLPMVKADAYGLGAAAVTRALEALEPWGYGVATVEEGEQLRTAGIERPVVVFTPLQPEWCDRIRASRLRPVVDSLDALESWIGGGKDPFHVEIDTGMGRAGFPSQDDARMTALGARLRQNPAEGVFTHFHSAGESPASVDTQWSRFQAVISALEPRPLLVHAANSAAALQGRRYAADLVRPGIFLYGGEAGGRYPAVAVRLQARVVSIRRVEPGETVSYGATWMAREPGIIATLGIGYADGLPRNLGGTGHMELGGTLVPIAGRVTMDMTMVALPPSATVAVGDVATVFGGRTSLDRMAESAGTVSYELLVRMGRRVLRRYHGGP